MYYLTVLGYQLYIRHCCPVYIFNAGVFADVGVCAGRRQLRQAAMPPPSFTSYVVSLLPTTGPSYVLTTQAWSRFDSIAAFNESSQQKVGLCNWIAVKIVGGCLQHAC